jgi:hypothetical protein
MAGQKNPIRKASSYLVKFTGPIYKTRYTYPDFFRTEDKAQKVADQINRSRTSKQNKANARVIKIGELSRKIK